MTRPTTTSYLSSSVCLKRTFCFNEKSDAYFNIEVGALKSQKTSSNFLLHLHALKDLKERSKPLNFTINFHHLIAAINK